MRLVGAEALSQEDQLLLEIARSIREDFLHQNAFHEVDTYASIKKQYLMLKAIMKFYDVCQTALQRGVTVKKLKESEIWESVARMRYIPEEKIDQIEKLTKEIEDEIGKIAA